MIVNQMNQLSMDGYTPVFERDLTASKLCEWLFWPGCMCNSVKYFNSKSH